MLDRSADDEQTSQQRAERSEAGGDQRCAEVFCVPASDEQLHYVSRMQREGTHEDQLKRRLPDLDRRRSRIRRSKRAALEVGRGSAHDSVHGVEDEASEHRDDRRLRRRPGARGERRVQPYCADAGYAQLTCQSEKVLARRTPSEAARVGMATFMTWSMVA